MHDLSSPRVNPRVDATHLYICVLSLFFKSRGLHSRDLKWHEPSLQPVKSAPAGLLPQTG